MGHRVKVGGGHLLRKDQRGTMRIALSRDNSFLNIGIDIIRLKL